jgi:hypothetical protein
MGRLMSGVGAGTNVRTPPRREVGQDFLYAMPGPL